MYLLTSLGKEERDAEMGDKEREEDDGEKGEERKRKEE